MEHEVDKCHNNNRLRDDIDNCDTNDDNESDDGHDKGGDNRIGSDGIIDEDDKNGGGINENEEADDEDSRQNGSDGDHHDCGRIEDELAEGSDLTEIGLSSEVNRNVKYVPTSSSCRRVQHGRHY